MKVFKKAMKFMLLSALASVFIFSSAACNTRNPDSGINEKVDPNRTQLIVGNFNRGYGDEWLKALKYRFEDFYKNDSFESGKTGVQVLIDNLQDHGPTYLNKIKNSSDAVIFNELVYYNAYVNAGVVSDITDIVRQDLSVYGDTGTIEDKMSEQHKEFYTAKDGKYYGIPHYAGYTGIIYDVDFFDELGFYLSANPDNGNNGFVKNSAEKRSLGPDGKTGIENGIDYSLDDGLPATYDEYFKLCEYIKNSGNVPTIWTGTHCKDYLGYLLRSMAVDYEGKEQIILNYTFDGTAKNLVESIDDAGKVTKREPVKITNKNGYELYTSAGRYYALDFLQRLIYKNGINSGYWYRTGFTGGLNQIEAQNMYLSSVYENERIAMLFDGIWWENEATETFNNMSAGNESMSKMGRKFGFMPFPKATTEQVGQKNTMMDTLYSMAFINKNAEKDPVVFDLAKKFLMFANTQQSLEEFSVITSTPKVLKYEISEENLAKMSNFGRSVWQAVKNSDIVYPISTNPLYLNNQSAFIYGESFTTKVDGRTITDIGSSMYYDKYSAKTMFEGIALLNSQSAWENLYSKYF